MDRPCVSKATMIVFLIKQNLFHQTLGNSTMWYRTIKESFGILSKEAEEENVWNEVCLVLSLDST